MFAYCLNNPVRLTDSGGHRPELALMYTYEQGHGGLPLSPNIEFLMAFYGVDSPNKVPELPDGAMIFVENITSVSVVDGACVIEGNTVVFDADKYCEYTFCGVGMSVSMSMALDQSITQGYVYGLNNVEDYCGKFVGVSGNMLSHAFGGAYASPKVYAEIVSGMSYAPSLGVSATWYMTGQSAWKYGKANMTVLNNPYQYSPLNPSPLV